MLTIGAIIPAKWSGVSMFVIQIKSAQFIKSQKMSSQSINVTKLESECVFLELLNREKRLYLAPVISSSQNALSKIRFPNKPS